MLSATNQCEYLRFGVLNLNSWKWVDCTRFLKDVHYIDQLTELAADSGHVISLISQVKTFAFIQVY